MQQAALVCDALRFHCDIHEFNIYHDQTLGTPFTLEDSVPKRQLSGVSCHQPYAKLIIIGVDPN
jgi:hypothetical protein